MRTLSRPWRLGRLAAVGVTAALAIALICGVNEPGARAQTQKTHDTLRFSAHVLSQYQVDMDYDGVLDLNYAPDGQFTGTLTMDDGSVVAVTGYANGVAVSLVLTTPDHYLFATGATATPLTADGELAAGGGQFVIIAPTSASTGVWRMCSAVRTQFCPD